MKNIKQNIVLYSCIAVALYVFFSLVFWGHLNYWEQMQMFTPNRPYFMGLLCFPGGANDILARWLTQWYFNRWIGAAIPAIVCTIFAFCMARTKNDNPLIAIASAMTLASLQLSDKDLLLDGATAILFVSIFITINDIISSRCTLCALGQHSGSTHRALSGVFLSILAGPFAGLVFLLCTIKKPHEIFTLISVPFGIALIYKLFVYYEMPYFGHFMGTEYYRFVSEIRLEPFTLGCFVILVRYSDRISLSKYIQPILAVLAICWSIFSFADARNEEFLLRYDKLARFQKWDDLLELAEEHPLKYKPAIMYVNLALAQKNKLGDEMFLHEQCGTEGLIPTFVIDADLPMMGAEVFYHLGLINTAERYTFEAQEAIPDGQKSVRAIKRLAQCNIIKEDYAVARRYLAMLKETFCYRKWALQAEEYINNGMTNGVSEWSSLRCRGLKNDLFFSEHDFDRILARLSLEAQEYDLAYNYLISYTLLKKDMGLFNKYFRTKYFENRIPRYYKEAYFYELGNKNPDFIKNISDYSDQELVRRMHEYVSSYKSNPKDSRLDKYKDLYLWYMTNR